MPGHAVGWLIINRGETDRFAGEQRLRIESIVDHPDLIETIAKWHWDTWGHVDPGGSLASWTESLRQRTNRGRIPTTFVALDRGELLGSVTLVEHDMETRCDLSPWLAGLYVASAYRGQGVGTALTRLGAPLQAVLIFRASRPASRRCAGRRGCGRAPHSGRQRLRLP